MGLLTRLAQSLFGGSRLEAAGGQAPLEAAEVGDRALAEGKHAQAIECYERALAADPHLSRALLNLGMAWAMSGDLERARMHFEKLLALDPKATAAHMNLGNIALTTGRLGQAVRHYESALALAPADAGLLNNLGMALLRQGLPEQATARFRRVLELLPEHADAAQNLLFALQHSPSASADDLAAVFEHWSRLHEAPFLPRQTAHANSPDPGRRLRIAYLSGDFFRHAVPKFIEPVLAAHDRGSFEVFAYYTRDYGDDKTQKLRALTDHWRDIAKLDDGEAAARIRADGIDILIDLSGHTSGNRLGIFALKPAPVQITYLGYPTTTGMHSMDYRISDAIADPPEVAAGAHAEKLLYLPRSQWCYLPDPAAPALSPLPALRTGNIMFGSFNNPAKLNDSMLAIWARVLHSLPGSALTITSVQDPDSRQRIIDTLARHGATGQQVRILGPLDEAEFWRIREDIDIVLDSWPYNGTTTTCEALWAGLPVVTLAGRMGAARNSASLLAAVGLPQLVAEDADRFVAIALELAGDLPKLAALRAGMRECMQAHGLCDAPRFTRELEDAYRQAWAGWCAARAQTSVSEPK